MQMPNQRNVREIFTCAQYRSTKVSRKVGTTHPVSDFDLAAGKRVCPEKVAVKLSQNEII
jgi:hypothetical protein